MRDPKLWTDLITAAWLIFLAMLMSTENLPSNVLLKVVPICLAFLLVMSHAKAIF